MLKRAELVVSENQIKGVHVLWLWRERRRCRGHDVKAREPRQRCLETLSATNSGDSGKGAGIDVQSP